MRDLKLKWQLFPSHVIILVCAMLAVAWYGTHSLKNFYADQMGSFLEAQSKLILSEVTDLTVAEKFSDLEAFCRETGKKISIRITVVEPAGNVICDSDKDYRSMQSHANRPEIIQALTGNVGLSKRYSTTTRQEMLYVAIPIRKNSSIMGILRSSVPLTAIESELQNIYPKLAFGMLVIILFASAITLFLARKISKPLEQMTQDSFRFAHGEFKEKIVVTGSEEIVGLAQAMNKMADQLDERMRTIMGKSQELETVLSSMVEGVIAVDLHEMILYMNDSAQEQLDVENYDVQGKGLLEVVRNAELLRLIKQTLSQDEQIEKTIVFHLGNRDERILQIHGAQLTDAKKNRIGQNDDNRSFR